MSTYEEAIAEAYASAPSNLLTLHTLTIDHVSFSQPIRVVHNTVPLVLGGFDYIGFRFTLKLPKVNSSGVSEISIRIDNASAEIGEYIEEASKLPNDITVTYIPYLWDVDLDAQPVGATGPQMNPPLIMTATRVFVTPFSVDVTASLGSFVTRKFPTRTYTLEKFPELLR